MDKIAIHPQLGVLILYHDQLNVIDTHIAEIKDDLDEYGERHQRCIKAIVYNNSNHQEIQK